MGLKVAGFFEELGLVNRTDSHSLKMKNFIMDQKHEHHLEILNYLSQGQIYFACMGVVRDVFKKDEKYIGTCAWVGDGFWIWPEVLHYYVKEYNVGLPDEFIDHMRMNNWRFPEEIHYEQTDREDFDRLYFSIRTDVTGIDTASSDAYLNYLNKKLAKPQLTDEERAIVKDAHDKFVKLSPSQKYVFMKFMNTKYQTANSLVDFFLDQLAQHAGQPGDYAMSSTQPGEADMGANASAVVFHVTAPEAQKSTQSGHYRWEWRYSLTIFDITVYTMKISESFKWDGSKISEAIASIGPVLSLKFGYSDVDASVQDAKVAADGTVSTSLQGYVYLGLGIYYSYKKSVQVDITIPKPYGSSTATINLRWLS